MSKSRDEIRNYLVYVEKELREYADGPVYDEQAEAAFLFMDDLADEIRAFLKEAGA